MLCDAIDSMDSRDSNDNLDSLAMKRGCPIRTCLALTLFVLLQYLPPPVSRQNSEFL